LIYTCPICNGTGFVPRKMYEVPGVTCSFGSYMNDNRVIQCNSCKGTGVISKNDWIKCTDRMPPDMEPVMVTVRINDGGKQTWVDVRYNPEYKEWEQFADAVGDYWEGLGKDYEVTHWMPYPEPAED